MRLMIRIALISDTHGMLMPELKQLGGVSGLVHAGDSGGVVINEQIRLFMGLEKSDCLFVKGNVDGTYADAHQPGFHNFGGLTVAAVHILAHHGAPAKRAVADLKKAGAGLIVFGHTHEPFLSEEQGVYLVNPGSAGPQRSARPPTAGWADIDEATGTVLSVVVIDLITGKPVLSRP